MKASWSKVSTVAAGCALMLAFVSGCAESHDPEPIDMGDKSENQPKQSGKMPFGEDADPTPTPDPDVEPVEVCGEISADDVRSALELPDDATVDDEDISPEASEEMAAGFACRYSWGDDPLTEQVTVSVIPETGKKGAQRAYTDIIGENAESYEDVGDVAGFDREGRFGPEMLAFVTVAKTERGLSSVTILGHTKASEDGFADLADKLLDVLG